MLRLLKSSRGFFLSYLKIKRLRYTQSAIAAKIGITPKTFYEKMKNGVFGSDEIQIMIDELNIEDPVAIFFAKE